MGDRLNNIHPGEVLKEEFLEPLSITAYRLSKDTGIPQTRLSEIIRGRRRITAATALRLSKYFGVSPRFWLGPSEMTTIWRRNRSSSDNHLRRSRGSP